MARIVNTEASQATVLVDGDAGLVIEKQGLIPTRCGCVLAVAFFGARKGQGEINVSVDFYKSIYVALFGFNVCNCSLLRRDVAAWLHLFQCYSENVSRKLYVDQICTWRP